MIKPNFEPREDERDDEWFTMQPDGGSHIGRRVNLSAITDYASIGLKAPAISALMNLGRNVIYQSTPMRAAYEKGRAILQMEVAGRAMRNMDTPAILGKWMDLTGVGSEDTTLNPSEQGDGDQSVDVRISFPKKPKDAD